MALRVNETVVRGEIDNRERGSVRGRVWVLGRDEPVQLQLTGNCWRDLAGCLIQFQNPEPHQAAEPVDALLSEQRGVAGDMTASRKVRVFDVPLEQALEMSKQGHAPPEHMANCLYLEWFSQANGRVVIESTEYKIEVSPPAWTPSPEEEKAQTTATQQAMREWLDRLDEALRNQQEPSFDPGDDKPLDEFGYEKFMRESDARTDQYMKLREKYKDHPDREILAAREMGWDWLAEALEADERGALPKSEPAELPPLEPNPMTEGVDWVRDEEGNIHHPLTMRVFESGMTMWHFCDELGLLEEGGDEDLTEMVFQYQTTGAKIAGALDGLAYDEDIREPGFIVAALKRALNPLNASMAAAEQVAEKELISTDRLEGFRKELFSTREEILALMQRFRSS
jgi:hypothetical protein